MIHTITYYIAALFDFTLTFVGGGFLILNHYYHWWK